MAPHLPKWLMMLGTLAVVSGCGLSGRPAGVSCAAPVQPAQALSFLAEPVVTQSLSVEAAQQRIAETFVAEAQNDRRGAVDVDVLTLSAGGQYGAFGAGFLQSWPTDTRPTFELVTGISAGALIAPIAFAGPAFDEALTEYDGLETKDIYRRFAPITWLTGASIGDPAPLRARLEASLTPKLMQAIATRHKDENAKLLVGATNLDTTEIRYFDLAEIAATVPAPRNKDCMIEVLMASAAIPALFPPRAIDGNLYADGGLRDHVFLSDVESGRVAAARALGRDVKVHAYIVVNGALEPPDGRPEPNGTGTQVDWGLIGTTARSVRILGDEVLRDSIVDAISFARRQSSWDISGIVAEPDFPKSNNCTLTPAAGGFDACLTASLFAHGRAVAQQSPIPWLTADALLARASAY